MFFTVKRLLPRSLFGRFLLITLVPVILVQLIAAYVFYERHWSSVSRHMAAALVGDVVMLAESIEAVEQAQRDKLIQIASNTLYLSVRFFEDKALQDYKEYPAKKYDGLSDNFDALERFDYLAFYTETDDIIIFIILEITL